LLESLTESEYTLEQKNRIRRNLEGFNPLTIVGNKKICQDMFNLVMSLMKPRPKNFDRGIKIFPWEVLYVAVIKIIAKYGKVEIPPELHITIKEETKLVKDTLPAHVLAFQNQLQSTDLSDTELSTPKFKPRNHMEQSFSLKKEPAYQKNLSSKSKKLENQERGSTSKRRNQQTFQDDEDYEDDKQLSNKEQSVSKQQQQSRPSQQQSISVNLDSLIEVSINAAAAALKSEPYSHSHSRSNQPSTPNAASPHSPKNNSSLNTGEQYQQHQQRQQQQLHLPKPIEPSQQPIYAYSPHIFNMPRYTSSPLIMGPPMFPYAHFQPQTPNADTRWQTSYPGYPLADFSRGQLPALPSPSYPTLQHQAFGLPSQPFPANVYTTSKPPTPEKPEIK